MHCPKSFLDLTIACVSVDPSSRPQIREILNSLRLIETEVLAMEAKGLGERGGSWNVGTLSFSGTTKKGKKRPQAPRLPSFEGTIVVGSSILNNHGHTRMSYDSSQDSENEVNTIAMANVRVGKHGIGGDSEDELLRGSEIGSLGSDYSTEVIRRNDKPKEILSTMESTITVRDFKREEGTHDRLASSASSLPTLPSSWFLKPGTSEKAQETSAYSTQHDNDPLITISRVESTASYMTARTSALSITGATIDHGSPSSSEDSIDDDVFHSTLRALPSDISVDFFPAPTSPPISELLSSPPALHRFSLIKPVFQKFLGSLAPYNTPSFIDYTSKVNNTRSSTSGAGGGKRGSVDEGSGGGIFGVKCSICEKRLGFMKAFLECDDCGFK